MSSEALIEANQYFTFMLGEEDFALEIGKVREVVDYTTITKVPRMPEFLRGVINLRGNVVPVIDLRLKLGMTATVKTVDTCIVIVEIEIDGDLMQVGALADSVKAVIDLDPGQIDPPPKLGTQLRSDFIRGMGKQDEKFIIILEIDRILTSDDLDLVKSTGDASEKNPNEDESRV